MPITNLSSFAETVKAHVRGLRIGRNGQAIGLCPFHPDERPSLSVDLDRGLFNCFACGAQGGVRRFAELVGEGGSTPGAGETDSRHPLSPLQEARARALAEGRRQLQKLEPYRDLSIVADFIRRRLRLADCARRVANALGPSERVWQLLAQGARLESEALTVEAEIDAILAEGRIA